MHLCDVLIICFRILKKKEKLDTANSELVINNGLGKFYLNWSRKGTITDSKHRKNGGLREKWILSMVLRTHDDMPLMLSLSQELGERNYTVNVP